jgi:hypothetical protein
MLRKDGAASNNLVGYWLTFEAAGPVTVFGVVNIYSSITPSVGVVGSGLVWSISSVGRDGTAGIDYLPSSRVMPITKGMT